MADMSERYMGTVLFGPNEQKIGTVAGLLTADDRRQYYVVETSGFLRRKRDTYYVPADRANATGARKLTTDQPLEQFATLGWTEPPAERSTR